MLENLIKIEIIKINLVVLLVQAQTTWLKIALKEKVIIIKNPF